jgi:hypothetical protein
MCCPDHNSVFRVSLSVRNAVKWFLHMSICMARRGCDRLTCRVVKVYSRAFSLSFLSSASIYVIFFSLVRILFFRRVSAYLHRLFCRYVCLTCAVVAEMCSSVCDTRHPIMLVSYVYCTACTMGAPRAVAGCMWAGREGGYAHAHCAVTKHYSCLIVIDSLLVTHVFCVCSCDCECSFTSGALFIAK